MAWTAPRTWVAAEVATASNLNTHLRDNFLWLGTRKGCSIRRASTVSVATATVSTVTFDTEDADTDGFFAPSSTTVTIPTGLGGMYAITARAVWAVSGQTNGFVRVVAGGTTLEASTPGTASGNGSGSWVVPLAAADTITCAVYQASGGSQTLNSCQLWVYWVGR